MVDFLQILLWIVAIALGSWWGVTGWFFALTHAQTLKDRGVRFGWFVKGGIIPYLVLGVGVDAVFNIFWGTILFRELPKEWLFSNRVSRHLEDANGGDRYRIAIEWANRINKIMPGHIKLQ